MAARYEGDGYQKGTLANNAGSVRCMTWLSITNIFPGLAKHLLSASNEVVVRVDVILAHRLVIFPDGFENLLSRIVVVTCMLKSSASTSKELHSIRVLVL